MTDTSDSDLVSGAKSVKDSQKDVLAAGSTALLENSPHEAAAKYKLVLDKMSCKSGQKISVTHLVIRYALCIAYLKSGDFCRICEATENLLDLIDSGYSSKLPALYLAIAKAYRSLNRFNKALEFIEKGLKAIQTNSKVKQHYWPGLHKPIDETGKEFLHRELLSLQKDCKNIQPPDAICEYDKCLEYSTHVLPAREIRFTDPDFKPFLNLQCDANCKVAYHSMCWEHFKNSNLQLSEPKDLVGMTCSARACTSGSKSSVIKEVNLIGPAGFDKPLSTWSKQENLELKSRSTPPEHNSTINLSSSNGSANKAKSKSPCFKGEEYLSELPVMLSPSIASSLCSSQDDVRSEPCDSSRFSSLVEVLSQCRAMKFGYSDEEYMNPQLQWFGHPKSSTYIEPNVIDKADKDQAEFIFSLYEEMFDENGHYRIDDLQEKWKSTVSDLGIPESFTAKYKNASEFLLKSARFAAIDDLIGTSGLLPDMFYKSEIEITQSVSYLLFSEVSRRKDTKLNNNNGDSHSHVVASTPFEEVDVNVLDTSKANTDTFTKTATLSGGNDNNDNPISNDLLDIETNITSDRVTMNGGLRVTSTPFVPKESTSLPQPEVVYMSDEDEEFDCSLRDLDGDIYSAEANQGENEVVPTNLSIGAQKLVYADRDSQTDDITDVEKENFNVQKDRYLTEIYELQYEKSELQQRINSLQMQVATLEAKHTEEVNQLQSMRDSFDEKFRERTEELKEVQKRNIALEEELGQAKELVKEKSNEITERDNNLDKIRRSHAKEINNFGQRLRQEINVQEEQFQNQIKLKDRRYMQLWKDFCEYKIKKFHHLCNDRINVLSQLKDMMSDSIRPTKSDIKSLIETYEEEMISVNLKNSEINEVYSQELEKVEEAKLDCLPTVIDIPDTMNMLYPPEGAFEYLHNLLKTKQDDFAASRNLFSPAVSRYPRSFAANGLQSSSQTRENEAFGPISNQSLFGKAHNETPLLWGNSFSSPSAPSSGMAFDVSNSNGPHVPLHQGFGPPSPMMVPQAQINLMSMMPSFPPMPSQSTPLSTMMGSARSTPSPLLSFQNGNGMAFNSTASTTNVPVSKAPSLGAIQKPLNPPMPTPLPKTTSSPVSAGASTIVSSQGAVSKPRVTTATASMTPIVPTKPTVRPLIKGSKTNESNYEKLMRNLQKMFPTRNDAELSEALKMARRRNGGTLSSLTHSEIISKVEEILSKQSKQTSMGWEKFGQAAWGTAKTPVVEWEGSDQDECCICMAAMSSKEVYTLECKHAFHKECIRKWLLQDMVCPICRVHSTMLDEFPPLG